MGNKKIKPIYAIIEKAYYRLQAGDVLTHCLEDGSTDPIHGMIQEMVLAGPQSLEALREILAETVKRKVQVNDDLNQVTNQLSIILKGYGISLESQVSNQILQFLNEDELSGILDDHHIFEADERKGCLQVLKDSQELIATLYSKIGLLGKIENYLQDWLWGLTYQHIKLSGEEALDRALKNDMH